MSAHHTPAAAPLTAGAIKRLTSEFIKLCDEPVPGITARPKSPEDLKVWEFALRGPEGSDYEFGVFTGQLLFPGDYPLSPPKMVFDPFITHPNVYGTGPRRGEVCISILHAGADAFGYERIEERWSPVHTIRSILLSVMSMLSDVNVESPANVEAAKLYSQHRDTFRSIVRKEVERSLGVPPLDG
jgi:ubiquitin-protein ligase